MHLRQGYTCFFAMTSTSDKIRFSDKVRGVVIRSPRRYPMCLVYVLYTLLERYKVMQAKFRTNRQT